MLKNYLAVALRNLRRERTFAIINILGLAIGLTICLLVMAYVADEWSYDDFHANADRIYRVNRIDTDPSGTRYYCNTPFPLARLLREEVPQTEAATRVIPQIQARAISDMHSSKMMITMADSNFFSSFTFPLASGSENEVLAAPNKVVVTESFASRFFADNKVIGQRLTIEWAGKKRDFVVSGIALDPPGNSTVRFQLVAPMSAMNQFINVSNRWNTSWPQTYQLVSSTGDVSAATAALNRAIANLPTETSPSRRPTFQLQPLRDIHLDTRVVGSVGSSSPLYSYLLGLVGLAVLILACINFTTLAIGRSQRRIREMGVRKVMGANRHQIIAQIVGETMVVAAIGMGLAVVMAELLLSHFDALAGKRLDSIFSTISWWGIPALGLLVVAAVFAGGYPALVLSRVRTVDAMRGASSLLTRSIFTRILIITQFGISATLIIVTLSMSNQLDFMLDAPMGFDKDQLVMVSLDGDGSDRMNTVMQLRQELSSGDGVLSVAATSADFTGGGMRMSNKIGRDSVEYSVFVNTVDRDYLTTMGMDLVRGENFSDWSNAPGSGSEVIVNESLAKLAGAALQWDDPIGREVPLLNGSRIVGVARDFHIQPFTSEIEPVALVRVDPGDDDAAQLQYALIRMKKGMVSSAMTRIRKVWRGIRPDTPFDYVFMDAHIESQYRAFIRWSDIVANAAFLAVLVACFGVFGLTALAAARRRKELGIRKVLGAHARQLIMLLNREYVVMTVIGTLIAWPLAYWIVQRWLEDFAYRTAVSPWPFLAGLVALIVVATLTASTQAYRAAGVNPTECLRHE